MLLSLELCKYFRTLPQSGFVWDSSQTTNCPAGAVRESCADTYNRLDSLCRDVGPGWQGYLLMQFSLCSPFFMIISETHYLIGRAIDKRYGSFMSDKLLESIQSGEWTKDTIDEFNNLLSDIHDGKTVFQRTSKESRPYSSGCSEAHVGASLLVRGKDGASGEKRGNPQAEYDREAEEGREQERLIESWAKANNLRINDIKKDHWSRRRAWNRLLRMPHP